MEIIKISDDINKKGIILALNYITFNGISVNKEYSSILENYISRIQIKIKKNLTLEQIKNNYIIRIYRDFNWHFLKIDPTKIRPASEALIRRILTEKSIPKISNVVDLINWVSIDTLIPLGAYDMATLKLPITLRFAKNGEKFIPIGENEKTLIGSELIFVDNQGLIIHQYPHRDSEVSKITLKTKNVLLIACGVPGINNSELENALIRFRDLLIQSSLNKISFSEIRMIT